MKHTNKTRNCSLLSGGALVRLVLLRHARADLHGRFCGYANPALSVDGRKEIPSIIQQLSLFTPSEIWSSDLRRAEETAAPIAEHFDLKYKISAGLREMNFGSWEGLSWEEVEARFPEDSRAWSKRFPYHRPPGGESFREFKSRVISELERLSQRVSSCYSLVVTHAGFIRTAIAWILGVPDKRISLIAQDYGAATILEASGGRWTVSAVNAGKFTLTVPKKAGDRT